MVYNGLQCLATIGKTSRIAPSVVKMHCLDVRQLGVKQQLHCRFLTAQSMFCRLESKHLHKARYEQTISLSQQDFV